MFNLSWFIVLISLLSDCEWVQIYLTVIQRECTVSLIRRPKVVSKAFRVL